MGGDYGHISEAGVGFKTGMYCFISIFRISSSLDIELRYSRICWLGMECSKMRKFVVDMAMYGSELEEGDRVAQDRLS